MRRVAETQSLEQRRDRSAQFLPYDCEGRSSRSAMVGPAAAPYRSKPWTGRPHAQLEQLAMDLGGAPKRVLKTHSSDQLAHLFSDPRPASRRTGFPSPVCGKTASMPAHDGLGLASDSRTTSPASPCSLPPTIPHGSPASGSRRRAATDNLAGGSLLLHRLDQALHALGRSPVCTL
jgi:hypothetical protein